MTISTFGIRLIPITRLISGALLAASMSYTQTSNSDIGQVDSSGNFRIATSAPGYGDNWTHVTNTGSGSLLFYDASHGDIATGTLDSSGRFTTLRFYSALFTRSWTHVASAGNGMILFYDAWTGNGTTARLDSLGALTVLKSYSTFTRNWTVVTGAGNGIIFAYNAVNGNAGTGHIDASGTFTTLKSYDGQFSRWWTKVVGAGNGLLLFYNVSNGNAATGRLDASTGAFTQLKSYPGGFAHDSGDFGSGLSLNGWTHITHSGSGILPLSGMLLFWDQYTGDVATGRVDIAGNFVTLHVYPRAYAKQWDLATGAGNGNVLLYDRHTTVSIR